MLPLAGAPNSVIAAIAWFRNSDVNESISAARMSRISWTASCFCFSPKLEISASGNISRYTCFSSFHRLATVSLSHLIVAAVGLPGVLGVSDRSRLSRDFSDSVNQSLTSRPCPTRQINRLSSAGQGRGVRLCFRCLISINIG